MTNPNETTLSAALDAASNDPFDATELSAQYLMMIHGGTTSSPPPLEEPNRYGNGGASGIPVPPDVAVATMQLLNISRTAMYYANTAAYYGRHAAAEAIEFAHDPPGYVVERAAEFIRPDGPAPTR